MIPIPGGRYPPFCAERRFTFAVGGGSRLRWLEVWGQNWLLATLGAAGWRCGSVGGVIRVVGMDSPTISTEISP